MRVLLLVAGTNPRIASEPAKRAAESGEWLRTHVFPETLGAVVVNYLDVIESNAHHRFLYKFLPKGWATAVEGFRKRASADVVVTWSEQITVAFAILQWIFRDKTPHVAMLYWMSKPLVRRTIKYFGSKISRIVTWSSVQRQYAIDNLNIPEPRISFVRHFVDERFWHHSNENEVEEDLVAAVGSEMRDYDTFIEAMRNSPLRCHIATREIRVTKLGMKARIYTPEEISKDLPQNITVYPLVITELRKFYDRAAVVVVPVLPSDTDNGVTVILEAMAMGKTVICSRICGQVDVIEHGINGFYVEPQNPEALRNIIDRVIGDKELQTHIGKNARAHIEKYHRLELFSESVKKAVALEVSQLS
jgi:glycosyltransferase involved in cell wall biosynthesis